ncbi:GTP-sensing pleiotropic transcriptional regulator CodY [Acidaminobacter hydrogenoformans]|uniref:Global transcriptional regulator CodY n=1 Tax=Acidaminobacter hydrogenoformans DSM 2784 TaxID=1120920 RepID=A0A1G5RU78_9FIRM|nr:transcriptional pleiotropic repressor [Acidaminobacter hydrogenoformans DSM 2784]
MSMKLLEKARRLNKILQQSGNAPVSFPDISMMLKEVLDANVYIISKRGKVLGYGLVIAEDSPLVFEKGTNVQMFPEEINAELLKIDQTMFNIPQDVVMKIFKGDISSYSKFITIVPIIGNGLRLGTLVVARRDTTYSEEDIVLAEYASTVVGMEVIRAKTEEYEEESRKKAVVQMAIGTLSYSELEAVEHIFHELDGDEGLLVASKIADRVGITRSVIVNALRKFESAGVIESRSLGMKGTYIRILNDKLMPELKRLKK